MNKEDYPDLYRSADAGASRSQLKHLWSIRFEYALLLVATLISSFRNQISYAPVFAVLIFLLLGGVLIVRLLAGFERDWYECRALAESVKTSTWRFAMRAHPFDYNNPLAKSQYQFTQPLQEILAMNRKIGNTLTPSGEQQITRRMLELRGLSTEERREIYLHSRVQEQKDWYRRNSKRSNRLMWVWALAAVALYTAAAFTLFGEELGLPGFSQLTDSIIVVSLSIVGWLQIRRYAELSTSYNLAAHEIGIIEDQIHLVHDEAALSKFVNEAELAFSREHTQWAARKENVQRWTPPGTLPIASAGLSSGRGWAGLAAAELVCR